MATTVEKYDCVAIGSGEAGKLVPWFLSAKKGMKCAAIESTWVGGSCPNIACLPSKTLIHSAGVAHSMRNAAEHGVLTDSVKVDMAKVQARKKLMVSRVNGFRGEFKQFGVEIIDGFGKFVGPKTVQVIDKERNVTKTIEAENIIICTGSRSRIDSSIPGMLESKPMTHIELLNLEILPSHLIVVGGGYIGMEFAQAFRRLGSEVTLIQRNKQVLSLEDEDAVAVLMEVLTSEGVKILTSTDVASVTGTNSDSVTLQLRGNTTDSITGSHLVICTGRVPNTSDMGLEAAGVQITPSGHIKVDAHMQTNVPGVYAAGDCANSPHFTHMGWDDHRVIFNAIVGEKGKRSEGTEGRLVPHSLFTAPELARVGLTEKQAKTQGIKYRMNKIPMGEFLRTQTLDPIDSQRGFAKALVEKGDAGKIIGFQAVGPGAGELLPVVTLAMKLGASYTEIEDLIIVHPTFNEGLVALFAGTPSTTV